MILTTRRLSAITMLFAAALAAPAQTPTQKPATPAAPVHHAATSAPAHPATAAAPACAKVPELSPSIPALPAGVSCAKPLYTVTTVPAAKLEYISPLENPNLAQTLGLEPSSFSLDYIDTKVGTGPLAEPHKFYTIHYTGYLLDGTKFDSSVDRGEPISVPYGQHQVIPGWDTGFDGMRIGGKRRLFIPFQLAYGATAHGSIPARSELIFDVELLSQSDTPPPPKAPATAKPPTDPTKPADPAKPADASKPAAEPATPASTPANPASK